MYKKEYILEQLEWLDNSELVHMWNEASQEIDPDHELWRFTEYNINESFHDPYQAISALFHGEVNSLNDDYFGFDGYGNLVSYTSDEAGEEAKMYIRDNIEFYLENEDITSRYIDEPEEEDEE